MNAKKTAGIAAATALALVTAVGIFQGWFQPTHRAKAPDASGTAAYPELSPSVIRLPVRFSLAPLVRAVNDRVPRPVVAEKRGWGKENYRYKVTRGDIGIGMSGNGLDWRIPIQITASGRKQILGVWHQRSCAANTTLKMRTRFSLDKDWRLVATTGTSPREFSKRCVISILNLGPLGNWKYDVTDTIDRQIRPHHNAAAKRVDAEAPTLVDAHDVAARVWTALGTPVPVADGAWLDVVPEAILFGGVSGKGLDATLQVGLKARPRLVLGAAPTASARPLPAPEPTPPGGGFNVALEVEVPFESASAALRAAVTGQRFALGEQAVAVEDLRVYGSGERAVIELQTSGAFKGVVYLSGRPRYNAKDEALVVEDLDYDTASRDLLARVADWIVHGQLKQAIAARARWPVGSQLAQARQLAQSALNRKLGPDVRSEGTVTGLEIAGIVATSDAFKLVVVAKGHAALSLGRLDLAGARPGG